jgi:hypothetical protein
MHPFNDFTANKGGFMAIHNEMFRVRKDIHNLTRELDVLNQSCMTKSNANIQEQIDVITEQLENLRLRMHILEKITPQFHPQ